MFKQIHWGPCWISLWWLHRCTWGQRARSRWTEQSAVRRPCDFRSPAHFKHILSYHLWPNVRSYGPKGGRREILLWTTWFLHLWIYLRHLLDQNSTLITSAGFCPFGVLLFFSPPIQIALRSAMMFNVPFATTDWKPKAQAIRHYLKDTFCAVYCVTSYHWYWEAHECHETD